MFSQVSIVTLELAREQLFDSLEQDVTLSQSGNIISQPVAPPNPYLLIYISKILCSQSPFSFFFQAEDGIRDLRMSRGLGDVYKRQPIDGGASCRIRGDKKSIQVLCDVVFCLWMPS